VSTNLVDVGDNFYRLLHPKTVVLVVSVDESGKPNVMTCAWNTPVSEDPPLVAIAISRESYTYELISRTNEYTLNIPHAGMLREIWFAGTRSGRKVDKVRALNLRLLKSKVVRAPVIDGCLGYLECKVHRIFEAGESAVVIGEVVAAYAREDAFKRGVWDLSSIDLPLHLGSRFFTIPREVRYPPRSR